MALYQTSVIKKYLASQSNEAISKAYKKFGKYFLNSTIQQNIRESKEEQFQAKFLDELFVNILGYTLSPQPDYNLTTELKNEKNSRKADGAILKDGKALGVIELKSSKTKDLESIRQQAFDYKVNQTGCVYVITSNFEKLRFYINNAVDFEEFDLFNLTEDRFALLFLCLEKESLLNNIPLKIKESSIQEEEAITKKFYNDYSLFKRELYRDLVKLNLKNEVFRSELLKEDAERASKNIKQTLFKKSQKLIDRFLFIFFAEDRGLLPPNSTLQILEQWHKLKELDAEEPLYSRFKKYFNYLDKGRKGTDDKQEIFAYNGGLFKPDNVLDSLFVSDDLLAKHSGKLQAYDFESQVDVNILGHIFENSLNEIESVNAEIEGTEFDKQKTKRKKDGVFYTPKYITKYIVDNTVGKLCAEKKNELGIVEDEYLKDRKGRSTNKLKELQNKLESYRTWLLQITICDPACGSGAFLNQALNFLIAEHQYISELQTKLLGGGIVFPDIENTILENNIYGVDLNEESVEIAKLSLWLRTAQPRRKLNDLSSNIKCGNSLIESKALAGNKAFKWEEQFPEVFSEGGFDVIIGNPPYVKLETIKDVSASLEKLEYKTFDRRGDLYVLFVEKGFSLLKQGGAISYIMPNKWLQAGYGKKLREFFLTKQLNTLIDFGDIQIFEGATTYPVIFLAEQNQPQKSFTGALLKARKPFDFESNVSANLCEFETNKFSGDTWIISSEQNNSLLTRLSKLFVSLKEYIKGEANYGIKTGFSEAYFIDENKRQELIIANPKNEQIIKPLIQGRDIEPYATLSTSKYLLFIPWHFPLHEELNISGDSTEAAFRFENDYPEIFYHLLQYKDKLSVRNKSETRIRYEWYAMPRFGASYYKDF